jgi:hypothetical protein
VEVQFSKDSAKAWRIASAVIVAGGAWVLYAWPPATTPFYPQCVFHAVTGLSCPGCGTTRALHFLLHGRVADAFRMNAMLFAIAPVSLLVSRRPAVLKTPWFAWGAFAMLMAWWIGRNIWPMP